MKALAKLSPFIAVLSAASMVKATIVPIPITLDSFNADVVVEKTATPVLKVVTTATVDQGTNNGANTWMEIGYDPLNPANGLPAPGTVITPPFGDVVLGGGANTVAGVNTNNPAVTRYSFKMPPDYTAPNGILINGDGTKGLSKGTFTLTTPAPYALLSFAGSGGNGGCVVGVATHHADGSIETNQFGCPDWFNGTSNVLFIANERVGSSVNFTYANQNSGNPRIYFRDIILTNTTSPVTSIDLFYVSGPSNSRNDIMAVSGGATLDGPVTPITVTGYTYDFIVEADAAKRGVVLAANGIDPATTQSMDSTGNTGNSWYEMGYNINNPDGAGVPIPDPTVVTNSGLPAAGSMITNAAGDRVYQLPPDYTKSNAVWVAIDPFISRATITLETPTAVSVLSLLASAGNGPVNNVIAITHHADATMETNLINIMNWFDGSPYVYGANGRVDVGTAQFNNVRNAARNPRLYPVDYFLGNTVSPVTSIEIINTNQSGGRFAIFAVSGTLDPVLPVFATQPQSVTVDVGANVTFTASAAANVPVTFQWQKRVNGVFVDLVDGGKITGATTTSLQINAAGEADDGEYRLVATDSVGSANSSVALLTILSPLADVTVPTDPITAYQPNGGSSPAAEVVSHAIDNVTQKYLNNGNGVTPMQVPVGFIVKPSMGRTIVTALRFYTANDTVDRDPANSILEGSLNGGVTWTLIASNALSLPAARNAGGTIALDPKTQAIGQVRFSNTNGYTSYRWYTTRVKGNVALMQIGEVELLGVIDTSPAPYFSAEPASVRAIDNTTTALTAAANGTPAPTLSWQRNTGSGFVALNDGGNITGSKTGNLTITPATFADAGQYICIAANSAGSATSMVATVTILSSLQDITVSGDPSQSFGDTSTTYPAEVEPYNATDNTTLHYRNGGIGLNAFTGFPPYEGPAGLIITPAMGYTLVTGLRVYCSDSNTERDPTAYELAGSDDGGKTFTVITSGVLDLPLDRNVTGVYLDPLTMALQEVLFPNTRAYTTYKFTVNHVRSNIDANSFQIGDLELLGVVSSAPPKLSISYGTTPGTIVISTTVAGTLWSSMDLKTWQNEGPVAPASALTITVDPLVAGKFYQIKP